MGLKEKSKTTINYEETKEEREIPKPSSLNSSLVANKSLEISAIMENNENVKEFFDDSQPEIKQNIVIEVRK